MFSGTPIDYQDEPLTNDGFWPDLNLADFQEQRSIPADVDAGTVATALLTAAGEVNDLLQTVKDGYLAKGFGQASAVPDIGRPGENLLCARYKKAVFARAKADLIAEFASQGLAGSRTQGRKVKKPAPGYWLKVRSSSGQSRDCAA